MHITLVDDSIPFDGYSASSRPLGGAEKAFASLPGALARLGHTVQVFNRCRWGMYIESAQWETFEGKKPLRTDVLIAFRKPALLEFVRHAGKRVFWHTGPGRLLDRPATRAMIDTHKPLLLLVAEAQARDFQAKGLAAGLLPMAVRSDYLGAEPRPQEPPRAVVTTHPAHGLDWLVDLWIGKIRPKAPDAELHIHSMMLASAMDGAEIDEALRPLAAKVKAAARHGVVVCRPQGDHLMAEALREARVHLYPGHADDMGCFTLMESQAAGCPAVIRPLGAAPERIKDGITGYASPDDDAFANLAAMLLTDRSVQQTMSAEARTAWKGRTWDGAAATLEGWLK
ncbi:glycosyl transferase group 1 family protein [Paramagnetospirillum magnetotacticum MS-1]|uniref:Glycosyl transferase group 1 family protein n=1 Tax=Paramagnetospirillum magnetotacticum MS-1 TaxID=272627 RepID=A0A0C2YYU3_PARME|nr:glycosyltransferase [Paramagnetospirillum magnetotacticum]KIL99840.1 glycosyl transferase group 1 family protein [Paramagnetospirillum magnetotacticum MS-1]